MLKLLKNKRKNKKEREDEQEKKKAHKDWLLILMHL